MTEAGPRLVAIALGSNLGDRAATLDRAVGELRRLLSDVRVSRYHETQPVAVPDAQPDYLNAALTGQAEHAPLELLRALRSIEDAFGRTRAYRNAPRTLDLDLILFDDVVVDTAELQLPHPRFRERRFVLAPLAEIAPDMRDPVTGLTVAELLSQL